jgi:hypothetical protein
VSTTATAVLYGTVAGQLVPTFTTYAEVTREAGAVAKPTGLAGAAVAAAAGVVGLVGVALI